MKTLSILFIAFTFSIHSGLAQSSPGVRKQQFNLEKGVAIQGYDPVAYFTQNKANPGRAVKGSAANAFTYKNVTYHFASAANLKAFQENPDKYEPQYGGWCAYAMGAAGEKVEVDPETFKITDGKLFLFYHTFINNTLTKWNKDEPNLHKKADASWSKFTQS
ncbi:MAG TPA: YHS domain-containing (seleno)protein [Spirosoma sp.]|jgi:YHS domain-containing protein|nr:YHS domain-containing (seleno)protein [Spirosoma sp.]